jgi:hypothetical protein
MNAREKLGKLALHAIESNECETEVGRNWQCM